MISANSLPARWPDFVGNTPSYNNEGDSTTGWTLTAATLSQPDPTYFRAAQSGTATAVADRSVTLPNGTKDWVLYGRTRGSGLANDSYTIGLRGSGSLSVAVLFNINAITNLVEAGTVSVRYISAGNVQSNAVAVTGLDLSQFTEWALHYDSKFTQYDISLRSADGRWINLAHVNGSSYTGLLRIAVARSGGGGWCEVDYLQLVSPDIIAIGDSITAGSTLFNPNITLNRHDEDSTFMNWASLYPGRRNNLIVNKGVGSNTSALLNSRLQADAMDNLAKVVILGACNNDWTQSVSLDTRSANIQSSVDIINNGGAKCVLVNALYGTPSHPNNPAKRAYYETWWREYRGQITGMYSWVNPMVVLRDANGYLNPAYAQADHGHPNVAGYTRYGRYLAGTNPD